MADGPMDAQSKRDWCLRNSRARPTSHQLATIHISTNPKNVRSAENISGRFPHAGGVATPKRVPEASARVERQKKVIHTFGLCADDFFPKEPTMFFNERGHHEP